MFYCNDCGYKKGWPTDSFSRSRGPCECCGETAICNDIKSGDLPEPIRDDEEECL